MYQEPKMEKLTINLPPMELARMDLLVEAGYYPSRTEFIRAAIRTQLDGHQDFIQKQISSITMPFGEEHIEGEKETRFYGAGILSLNKEDFEETIRQGKSMKITAIGMLRIAKDVTPQHIEKAVVGVKVYGILRASPEVKAALQRLMKQGAGA
ncbi:MAG: ribbon-helix-helix protein, CopG family [Candidatus Thorarchaeota archaeon]